MYCIEECQISKVYKIHLTTFCVAVMLKVSAQLLRQSKPSQELAEVNLLFLQGIYHLSYGLKTQGKNLEKPPDKNSWCKTFASVNFLDCQKAWEEKFHWKARMWKSVHNVFLSKSAVKFSLQFHILLHNCICTFKDKVQAEWGVFIKMRKLRFILS